MVTKVTSGVKISVESKFRDSLSNSTNNNYFFSYKITIENQLNNDIQLLRRCWFIFDSLGGNQEVNGIGVIGEQPIIKSGENFVYESGCNLTSDIGAMHGSYLMLDLHKKIKFEVQIPKFNLILPHKVN